MRKYGKLLLVLGVLAANPAWVSADGLLSGLRPAASVQKQKNQKKAEEVGRALQSVRINGYDLQVEVRGDAVKLDGKVRDVTHRALAEQACRKVAGIRTVQNNLRYVPGGTVQQTSGQYVDSAVRPAYHMSNSEDTSIQQVHFTKPGKRKPKTSSSTTTTRTSFNPFARSAKPAAPATQTPARTVAQTATPAPAKPAPATPAAPQFVAPPVTEAAPEPKTVALPAVPEVKEVAKPLVAPKVVQPKPAARSNQEVAQNVANNLSQVGLTGYDVEIRFDKGVATLGGEVATDGQRQAAEFAASRVPEVAQVRNQLTVQQQIAQTNFPAGPAPAPAAMTPYGAAPYGAAPMGMAPAGAPTPVGGASMYSNPQLPDHAWPAYAQYPNSAAIQYPTQYSASAFPYIGPFYPYPQVPLGWRESRLEWDDGHWQLSFGKKKDAWYWLFKPKNWD